MSAGYPTFLDQVLLDGLVLKMDLEKIVLLSVSLMNLFDGEGVLILMPVEEEREE